MNGICCLHPTLTFLDTSLQPVHEACKFPRPPCPLTLPAGGVGRGGGGGKEGEVTPVLSSWWCPRPLRWQQLRGSRARAPAPGSRSLSRKHGFWETLGFPLLLQPLGPELLPPVTRLWVFLLALAFPASHASGLNALC